MTYWIAVGTQEKWEVAKETGIWGIPTHRRYLFHTVHAADILLIFRKMVFHPDGFLPAAIVGEFRVTGLLGDNYPDYLRRDEIDDEQYSCGYSVELNNEFLPPIELKPLVQDLQFIENKKHWAIHLTPLLRKIPQEDYKKIVSTR